MPYKDPNKRKAYARDYKRNRGAAGITTANPKRNIPLATSGDVADMLRDQMREICGVDVDPLLRGRCLAYMASVLCAISQQSHIEERITRLENMAGNPADQSNIQEITL